MKNIFVCNLKLLDDHAVCGSLIVSGVIRPTRGHMLKKAPRAIPHVCEQTVTRGIFVA